MRHGKLEYSRLNEVNEKENGDEATQRGMGEPYQRIEAEESFLFLFCFFVLNPVSDRQNSQERPVEADQ